MKEYCCPECGAKLESKSIKICPNCGYPLHQGISIKVIIIVAITIIVVGVGTFIGINVMADKNMESAIQYEEALDYDSAIKCYSKIPSFNKRYDEASQKAADLKKIANMNKFVAKAFVALSNKNIASKVSELEGVNADNTKLACCVGDVGYIVSIEKLTDSFTYGTISTENITGLYVTTFEYYDINWGLYGALYNMLGDTKALLEMRSVTIESGYKSLINFTLVQKYVDEYNSNPAKELSVFDYYN